MMKESANSSYPKKRENREKPCNPIIPMRLPGKAIWLVRDVLPRPWRAKTSKTRSKKAEQGCSPSYRLSEARKLLAEGPSIARTGLAFGRLVPMPRL